MKKYAVMLTGQGSQYIGMGKNLYDKYEVVKQLYHKADDILGFSLKEMCFNGDINELTDTKNAQPAILLAGVAAYRVFLDEVKQLPSYIVGHSIGEITALTCAETIRFEDAIQIVRKRGELMSMSSKKNEGAMAAIIGLEIEVIENICGSLCVSGNYVGIANYNSYSQVVISGHKKSVEEAVSQLNDIGAKCIPLNVSGAFHSPLMQSAVEEYTKILKQFAFEQGNVSVISNVNAIPYGNTDEIVTKLTEQIVKPVQWVKTMEYLNQAAMDCVIDMGPKNIVCNLAKSGKWDMQSFAYEGEREKVIKYLGSSPKMTQASSIEYDHSIVSKCIAITICTKNNNDDTDEYEKGVIQTYRRLQELQTVLEKEGRKPSEEESIEAINLLKKIFETKRTPFEEQAERFQEISKVAAISKYIINQAQLNTYL